MMVLRAGIMTLQPSRPNRFSEDHFLARKSSKLFEERRERMEKLRLMRLFMMVWSRVLRTKEVAKSPASTYSRTCHRHHNVPISKEHRS